MVVRGIVTVCVALCAGAVFARSWQDGNLTVELFDVYGKPITDAKVTVKSGKGIAWGWGLDSEYNFTSANSDANGIAEVKFRFCEPDFIWFLETPSHYSQRYFTPREFFKRKVVESDYKTIDTNTVEGLAKWNELKKLEDAGDEESMLKYMEKFAPKSVTYTKNGIRRSLKFYPKRNPQPMYAYGKDDYIKLPNGSSEFMTNGYKVVRYEDVAIDLKNNVALSGDDLSAWESRADFVIEEQEIVTNDVKTFVGKIRFAPGCGAYRCKYTGDASFPTTYAADVNMTYESEIRFSASRDMSTGKLISQTRILQDGEYMVLRTRKTKTEKGVNAGWHYSKVFGPLRICAYFQCQQSVFNPRLNDPNLELDLENNLARPRYKILLP